MPAGGGRNEKLEMSGLEDSPCKNRSKTGHYKNLKRHASVGGLG
jgi:hypothetical protein